MDENTLFTAGGEERAEPEQPAELSIQTDAPDIGEAVGDAPAPEMGAEEMEALAGEFEKALHDIGEEKLEPPAPFDIPDHEEVVLTEAEQAALEAEKPKKFERAPRQPKAPK